MTDTAYTHLEFVLDRSGSMSSIRTATQDGFNAFIADQRGRAGRATVSLQQFDDTFDTVYTMVPIDQVPPLTLEPRGSTALLDAVGRTIVALGSRLAAMPEASAPEP